MAENKSTTLRKSIFITAIFAAIIASIFVIRFASYLFMIVLLAGTCTDQIVSESLSPNRKLRAVLYVRDCGATTRASTIVTILPASQSRPRYGSPRVFSGYETPWYEKVHKVSVQWTSDQALTVYYAKDVELTGLNNWVKSVHVYFQLRPDAANNGAD